MQFAIFAGGSSALTMADPCLQLPTLLRCSQIYLYNFIRTKNVICGYIFSLSFYNVFISLDPILYYCVRVERAKKRRGGAIRCSKTIYALVRALGVLSLGHHWGATPHDYFDRIPLSNVGCNSSRILMKLFQSKRRVMNVNAVTSSSFLSRSPLRFFPFRSSFPLARPAQHLPADYSRSLIFQMAAFYAPA